MPHFLQISDIEKLLAAAKRRNEKHWLMILVPFLHALRAHEVVGGTASWKNKITGEKTTQHYRGLMPENIAGIRLVLPRLKNSNPVDEELFESENLLFNERQPLIDLALKTPRNQRLFPVTARTFQRIVHRYGELAGLPDLFCHTHMLKGSGLDYLREKMSLEELQHHSGHKSLDALRVYLNPSKVAADRKARAAFMVPQL
jgi:integrase